MQKAHPICQSVSHVSLLRCSENVESCSNQAFERCRCMFLWQWWFSWQTTATWSAVVGTFIVFASLWRKPFTIEWCYTVQFNTSVECVCCYYCKWNMFLWFIAAVSCCFFRPDCCMRPPARLASAQCKWITGISVSATNVSRSTVQLPLNWFLLNGTCFCNVFINMPNVFLFRLLLKHDFCFVLTVSYFFIVLPSPSQFFFLSLCNCVLSKTNPWVKKIDERKK